MTIQDFMHLDPDKIPPDLLAEIGEHMLCDEVPCEYCEGWTPRTHEWKFYRRGGIGVCDKCLNDYETMLRRLIERRRQPPWSGMRMIFFHWKVISVGLGRTLRRHLIRMAFEDFYECQRLTEKWM